MDPAQVVQDQIPKKKKPLIPILLALLIIIIGIVAWFILSQKSSPTQSATKVATSSAKTETPTPNVVTPEPVVDDTALITTVLVTKTGIAADIIDVTVSTKIDNFVKGLVSTKGEETGGGYYLAFKDKGNWYIVYDGQSTPDCSAVNPFNFPVSMVPECLDAGGNLVKR
jgi:hypothetical protein